MVRLSFVRAISKPPMARMLGGNALGGGNEVLGGVWVLGLSIVALRERLFARWTNYLGAVMGIAGLATVVPALENVGAIFGLGLIVWFIAVGMTLIKDRTVTPEASVGQSRLPSLSV
jgi:hypothetical protein